MFDSELFWATMVFTGAFNLQQGCWRLCQIITSPFSQSKWVLGRLRAPPEVNGDGKYVCCLFALVLGWSIVPAISVLHGYRTVA